MTVWVLTAVALAFSGVVLYTQGEAGADRAIAADGQQAVAALRALANQPDPATGAPFADPSALLYTALQRLSLAPSEGAFALVDGSVRWQAAASVTLRPEADPDLVAPVVGQRGPILG
ncbi:MAG: hypothetical protein LBR33_05505 [Propionibacteriaceae bacterium]|nr:hypothetical protein [Propionibacteriaceae bacterium]